MATLYNGILGAPIGRVGPVTGYIRNGKSVLRVAKNNGVVRVTPARLAQRAKINACNEFTRAFTGTDFFKTTFPAYGSTGNGYNRAMSYLMNQAVTGTYPHVRLEWERVLIAGGPLPKPINALAAAGSGWRINFTWTNNSDEGTARPTDRVILVAYAPALQKATYNLSGGNRQMGMASLDAAGLNGEEMATWMAFINDKGDVSDSVFCGMI